MSAPIVISMESRFYRQEIANAAGFYKKRFRR